MFELDVKIHHIGQAIYDIYITIKKSLKITEFKISFLLNN